jgi:hypothetical protein
VEKIRNEKDSEKKEMENEGSGKQVWEGEEKLGKGLK